MTSEDVRHSPGSAEVVTECAVSDPHYHLQDASNRLVYMDAIRNMCSANLASLEVDYRILAEQFPTLGIWLLDAPADILDIANEVRVPSKGFKRAVPMESRRLESRQSSWPRRSWFSMPSAGGQRGGPQAVPPLQEHPQGRRPRADRRPSRGGEPATAPPGEGTQPFCRSAFCPCTYVLPHLSVL